MDERRARIHDDLRGLIAGELRFEAIGRAPYAHDASIFEIDPLGVVVPRTLDDLTTTVRYAAENGIPVHARGAGTGLAGGALGPGLVVDFSRHFRRIISIGPESVVVQPGVVLDVLNAHLAPLGRKIGPDPSGPESRTVGGMIAVNAAGSRSIRYGTTADYVERLSVVFAGAETAELGFEPWPSFEQEPVDLKGHILRKLAVLARRHADLLSRSGPKSPRNRAGYALASAVRADGIDLARLLVGSEGTLALVAEATLTTVPLPAAQSALLLPFGRLSDAASAVADVMAESPSACDLFDWRSLSLARDAGAPYKNWVPEAAEAALVVEFEGDDADLVAERARRLARRIEGSGLLVADAVEVHRKAGVEALLGLRRAVVPQLMRRAGRARPVPFVEDLAVPPEMLPRFLQRLQAILRHHEVPWTLYAHAGDGQLHVRPFLDLAEVADRAKLEPLADDLSEAAWEFGGTVSGEHGCGLVRTQFLRRQSSDLARINDEIKEAFDPAHILNPGKVVGHDPHLLTRHLRPIQPAALPTVLWPPDSPGASGDHPELAFGGEPAEPAPGPVSALRWAGLSMLEAASNCNGCGTCRTQEPTMRMCPTFRASRDEAASPRAQANLVRQVATGAVDPKLWGTEEFRRNAGLCIHCNLCRTECPSGVDVSTLMLEAKAAYVENHGLAHADWFLARIDIWSSLASRFPLIANALLGRRSARWVMERATGLSRYRRLPRANRTPFVRRAERMGLTQSKDNVTGGRRVAYFVDVYANHYDQELAESVVGVLQHAGVDVLVPKGQRGSGMPALVAGDLEHARDLALANLRVLGDAVRDGYTIVCSEPTAALMLKVEYLKLTDDLDAALVAENTRDVGDYLREMSELGELPRPETPVRARVGYHQPCHLRSLDVGTPGLDLIRGIPELNAEFIDRGCSGMAGTFGLAKTQFRTSLRAGRGLLRRFREDDIELGATECGACRMQMEQPRGKVTLHPIKLLSLGYGLNPSLRDRLRTSEPNRLLI
ncbi:FAD-linked oxidase C-terminal domain-containing protein [Isosphaeraceae bacterium EP7]